MKKIYLLTTQLWFYLTELPLIALLALSMIFNDRAAGKLKLYPLISIISLAIIFILIYAFRIIRISYAEIRAIGPFSSREHALIVKDTRFEITQISKTRIRIELFATVDEPAYEWARMDNSYKSHEINIFRGKGNGTRRTVMKLLTYFGVNKLDYDKIFKSESFSADYENVTLASEIKDEHRVVSLKINEII